MATSIVEQMFTKLHRDSYMRDFNEAMENADLQNLDDAVSDICHQQNLRRHIAITRLELAGEQSLSPLIEILKKRDPERLATSIAILTTLYRRQKILHPEFASLLNGIIHSDLPMHIRRSCADVLGSVSCGRASPEIHETFVDMLFWKDLLLREYAIQYFQWSKSQSSVVLLSLLLDDENQRIAYLAEVALEHMGRADGKYMLKVWKKRR